MCLSGVFHDKYLKINIGLWNMGEYSGDGLNIRHRVSQRKTQGIFVKYPQFTKCVYLDVRNAAF